MTLDDTSSYLRLVLDQSAWLRVANGLLDNAGELEEKVTQFFDAGRVAMEAAMSSEGKNLLPVPSHAVVGVYFMLVAYGIENLLKAQILGRHLDSLVPQVRKSRKLPRELEGHALRDLAKRAGLNVSPEEEELLLRLTSYAIWRGRYPAPTTVHGLSSTPLSNQDFASQSHFSRSDLPAIDALITKLRSTVQED